MISELANFYMRPKAYAKTTNPLATVRAMKSRVETTVSCSWFEVSNLCYLLLDCRSLFDRSLEALWIESKFDFGSVRKALVT